MPKKTEEKERKAERIGVPPVSETYQEIQGIKKVDEDAEKRGKRREEKVHEHQEHEKAKGYKEHLPPVEDRIKTERPPYK